MPRGHKDLRVKILRIYRGKSCCHDHTYRATGVSSGRLGFLVYLEMAMLRLVDDELEGRYLERSLLTM